MSIIAHWKLNGNAKDQTGSHDGTETDVTYVNGLFGAAALSDGATDTITVADHADLDIGAADDFSVSLWFKDLPSIPSALSLLRKRTGSNAGWDVYIAPLGIVAFFISDGTDEVLCNTVAGVGSGSQWHHLVVQVEGDRSAIRIYFDGVESDTSVIGTLADVGDCSNAEQLEILPSAGVYGDEIQLYDHVLTDREVLNLYRQGIGSWRTRDYRNMRLSREYR